MVMIFFFLLVGLCECVLALREEERGEKKYGIRPLISGPATDNLNIPEIPHWFLMNFQLGVLFFSTDFESYI